MWVYLREPSKYNVWKAALSPDNSDDGVVQRVVSDLSRNGDDEVSVYRCLSAGQRLLTAVALAARPGRGRDHLYYIEITWRDVWHVGASLRCTAGETPIPKVNRWHREVDLSNGRIVKLVRRLRERGGTVDRVSKDELKERARNLGTIKHSIPDTHWMLRST